MKNIAAALLFLLFAATALLTFVHLGNAAYWDDEAYVGIFARNLIATGHLTGWDGRNLYAYRDGTLLDDHLNDINPPLDVLVAAGSFKLFGVSNWAGRAPFVLAGLIALGVFARLLVLDFPEAVPLRLYALSALALSPAFLLNIRNCRYYALSLLFSLLCALYARIALRSGKAAHFLLLGICGALSFYSSFYLGPVFLIALLIALAFFHRSEMAKNARGLIVAVGSFLLLTAPYAIMNRIWVRRDIPAAPPWYNHPLLILWNFRELSMMDALPWLAAVALAIFYYLYRPIGPAPDAPTEEAEPKPWPVHRDSQSSAVLERAREWIVLAAAYVVLLSLLSPQDVSITNIADIRYLFPVLPFTAGLCGIVLWFVHRSSKLAAAACLLVLVGTNILTLTPAVLGSVFPYTNQFRWLLPHYIEEISRPYPTANEAVADYLNRNAKQDDLVLCAPDYEDYPVAFYTGSKIKLCCQLDHKSPLPIGVVQSLNAPVYLDQNFPDWIVFFGPQPNAIGMLNYFSRPHLLKGKVVRHFYRISAILGVFSGQTQRPELPLHSFGPVSGFDPRTEGVYILKATPEMTVQQTAPKSHG